MFRVAHSALALRATKTSCCITTYSFKRHQLNERSKKNDEEDSGVEQLDNFTKEFISNQIKVTDFQRILLTAGSSIAALLDPRRQDMIACLGETTGEDALHKVIQIMRESEEGKEVLKEKPRINTKTVNLEELKSMPENSMGYHYYKFLEDNVSFHVAINGFSSILGRELVLYQLITFILYSSRKILKNKINFYGNFSLFTASHARFAT